MRYWDSSALVPLIHEEAASDRVRGWLREDPVVATWALTRLEIAAAIERLVREGRMDAAGRRSALDLLARLSSSWHEVNDVAAVRTRALGLVARHPLRSADAAQLAAALLIADPDPSSVQIVCLDARLCEAGEREGMRVLSISGDPA